MTPFELWLLCREKKVRLKANRPMLEYRGPKAALAEVIPLLRDRKSAMLDLIDALDRLPVDDGPFTPYMPPIAPEQVRQWQKELDTAIVEFAALAGWLDDLLERVLFLVERQPVSTLMPDLHWFRSEVQAAIVAHATSMEPRR